MQSAIKHINANGLQFAYFEVGQGPLMLLFHGFPDTPHTWAEVQPQFAAAGYRVVTPFMRGYPPTTAPADGNYSARQLGEDVLALIEALGETQAVVVGHDWGALAAYTAANLNPARVHKLITLAIPHPGAIQLNLRTLLKAHHFITFQFRPFALASLRRNDFAGVAAIYKRWSPNWAFTAADLAPVKEAFKALGGLEGALGYYWSLGSQQDGGQGAKTSVPTLSFFGEADGALDQSSLEQTRACFTNTYEMVRLPTAGHFIHREAPQIFVDKTLAFLKQ